MFGTLQFLERKRASAIRSMHSLGTIWQSQLADSRADPAGRTNIPEVLTRPYPEAQALMYPTRNPHPMSNTRPNACNHLIVYMLPAMQNLPLVGYGPDRSSRQPIQPREEKVR